MAKSEDLEKRIGYTFQDARLLETALSHSSYAAENKGRTNNQRMEYLGDAVLELCISKYLFMNCRSLPEGELTRLRASIVSEPPLAQAARRIGLDEKILLGAGEKNSGGAEKPSILSDCFEAVVAAVFLDGGFAAANDMILANLAEQIDIAIERKQPVDYKTTLQELLQKSGPVDIEYTLLSRSGPAHSTVFEVQVSCDGKILGRGQGNSKKYAEQQAAQQALLILK